MYTLVLRSRARSDMRRLHPTIRARVLEKFSRFLRHLSGTHGWQYRETAQRVHRPNTPLTTA